MNRREQAEEFNAVGQTLHDRGDLGDAIKMYKKAAAVDPRWAVPLFNLGLLFKQQRRWKESLLCNRKATAIDPDHEGVWWNLGIAATALRRWQAARAAWRGFGIDVPDGRGPLDLPCGFTPIRINPDGEAEVVWAHRLDPARAELASVPLPESGHRWRDVVLNDGAPNGYRQYDGREYPVFDELQLFQRSPYATFVARVRMPRKRAYSEDLMRQAANLDGNAEDWSTSLAMICKACSEGRPHKIHDGKRKPPKGAHLIAIAARNRAHASEILHAWETGKKGIRVEWLADPS
jgi:tetratricopeptide (TPR) repeat protein